MASRSANLKREGITTFPAFVIESYLSKPIKRLKIIRGKSLENVPAAIFLLYFVVFQTFQLDLRPSFTATHVVKKKVGLRLLLFFLFATIFA